MLLAWTEHWQDLNWICLLYCGIQSLGNILSDENTTQFSVRRRFCYVIRFALGTYTAMRCFRTLWNGQSRNFYIQFRISLLCTGSRRIVHWSVISLDVYLTAFEETRYTFRGNNSVRIAFFVSICKCVYSVKNDFFQSKRFLEVYEYT